MNIVKAMRKAEPGDTVEIPDGNCKKVFTRLYDGVMVETYAWLDEPEGESICVHTLFIPGFSFYGAYKVKEVQRCMLRLQSLIG